MKKILILTMAVVAMAACGLRVEEREVTSGNLTGAEENAYYRDSDTQDGDDLSNLILFNNVVFLWPSPLPAEVSKKVLRASSEINKNDDLGIEKKTEMQKIDREIELAKTALDESAADLDEEVRTKLVEIGDKLDVKSTLTPTDADAEYEKELQAEIDALNASLSDLPAAVAHAKVVRDSAYDRKGVLFKELFEIGLKGEELLAIIEGKTEMFRKPERIAIDFRASPVKITITDWPEKGDIQSTESGTIHSVQYDPARWGRLKFLVDTTPGQQYFRFRLNQTKLNDPYKRVFYQGVMERYDANIKDHFEGKTPSRHGQAKLVNRNG